ncbi:MAG: polymer-forming cytoskeletal protein [Betaproteobacteria bacterium]|nr:polymer-forming cytoskeletal protein [Betaproteobacteria bacterium]
MEDISHKPNDVYIPAGVKFVGTIHVPGLAQINGQVSGEVTANTLDIGPQGHISGKVRAKEIDVYGFLKDDVVCQGLLQIRKSGKVSGKLSYADIDIERGGQFEGDMQSTG